MKKFYVYILQCADHSYYVGITNDISRREQEHNDGLDTHSYTFQRRPVRLVWYQEFTNPSEAISKEKQLKGWSRKKKEALIGGDYMKLPSLSRNTAKKRFDRLSATKAFLQKLPYSEPFLFVDEVLEVNANSSTGCYTFSSDAAFYKGHFKDNPITPGVILTECCAQIGLVCLGIHLLDTATENLQIALSSSEMEFYLPVFPNEKVTVTSTKTYFRFHKLKCEVKMYNAMGALVCKGTLAGMFKTDKNG